MISVERFFLRFCPVFLPVLVCFGTVGCGQKVDMNARYVNKTRSDKGLVAILPGIEGQSSSNENIRKGLYEAGIPYSLAIYRWGFPLRGIGLLVNQTDTSRARRAAVEMAKKIVEYQKKFPGRPVYVIGHSAGGGVAVFMLEALNTIPDAKPVDGAFLLSSSISANYPLENAIRMTRKGLVNVYNRDDKLLDSGTAMFGNIDGGRGDSAGRTGFRSRHDKVFEREVTAANTNTSGSPHFVATKAEVIRKYAPAWILGDTWPPQQKE